MAHDSRSGKTFIIVRNTLIRASKIKSRHISLRQTFNSIKTSIFLDTLPKVLQICFPELSVKYNKTDYYITLPNGSEYWFGGLDDERRLEKILGREFSTMHFNEITQMDFRSVQLALSRLAEKNDLSKKVFYDFNPSKKTHWSYYQFIKKLNPSDDEPLENPDDYKWIRMNPRDNIENIDEEYINLLNSMPEKERLRFLEGEFDDESDGNAYYAFNREIHVKDIKRKPGSVFVFMDFNVDPMTACIAQLIDNKIYVIDEVFLNNSDTYKMCDALQNKGYAGCTVIPDSTGRNRKTSGKSDFQILRENGFTIQSTHNPFVTDRVNNVNRLFTANEIIINTKCKKLIADLEKVVWKDNKLDQKTDKHLTHISDALGYGCYKLKPFNTVNLTPSMGNR